MKIMDISENTISVCRALDVMSKNLNNQDLPRVGIFWYDVRNDDLFGVVSSQVSEASVSEGLSSVNTLHRDWWKKQYNKSKFKNNDKEKYPFVGVYKDTPRGRVFYDNNTELFVIKLGSWINKHPNAKPLIMDEFNLAEQNCRFEIDIHWEVGHGWEEW